MGFSRQEHWSGLPCPPAGDLAGQPILPEIWLTTKLTVTGEITETLVGEKKMVETTHLKKMSATDCRGTEYVV